MLLHFTQLSMYKKFNQNFKIQSILNNSHKKKEIKNQFSKNLFLKRSEINSLEKN